MKRKRVTILTGAGFTLPFGTPSTKKLTDIIRNKELSNLGINGKPPGEYFFEKLCKHYKESKSSYDVTNINFETIIHLLEEIYSFQTSLNKTNASSSERKKGTKPSLFCLKDIVKKDLEQLKTSAKTKSIAEGIKYIYYGFIDAIVGELIILNSDKNNIGMNTFRGDFLNKHLSQSQYIRKIYTLNYDTWLNKYGNLYDGFDSAGKFQSKKVTSEFDYDSHYNLHGSILWKNSNDTVTKVTKPFSPLKNDPSSNSGLDRELIIAAPIISGYNKLQRMKFSPYLEFYYSLQRDILDSEILILIGYSFSDVHINNILSLYENKCIVVDYIHDWNTFAKYDDSLKTKVTPIKSIKPSSWNFDHLKDKKINQNGWVASKNGNVKFWWKGIGNDFYDAWEIIKR